jgi:hypothetical protein
MRWVRYFGGAARFINHSAALTEEMQAGPQSGAKQLSPAYVSSVKRVVGDEACGAAKKTDPSPSDRALRFALLERRSVSDGFMVLAAQRGSSTTALL